MQAIALSGYSKSVTGTVFEDVNYGGGAGRSYAAANVAASASGFALGAIGRPGVQVELYDTGGTFITATITDAVGNYSISGLSNGTTYTVRVVNQDELPPSAQLISSPYDLEAHFSRKRTTTWVGYKVYYRTYAKDVT